MNKKKNLFSFLAPILLFVLGVGIFLYPAISNLIAENEQKNSIHTYQAAVDQKNTTDLKKEWEQAKIYNENLAGDPVHDPFVMGSGYILPDNYKDVLNINHDGIMGYIDIPKINVHLPIYHGTSEDVLEKGAGHLDVSSLPIGGKSSHSIISAHRGLPSALLFTDLDQLKNGDIFYIHVLDKTLTYEVDKINVIDPKDLSLLKVIKDKDLVTLLTCTPYGVNTQRLLVRGKRIPYKEVKQEHNISMTHGAWFKVYIYVICFMFIFFIVLFIILKKRKSNRR